MTVSLIPELLLDSDTPLDSQPVEQSPAFSDLFPDAEANQIPNDGGTLYAGPIGPDADNGVINIFTGQNDSPTLPPSPPRQEQLGPVLPKHFTPPEHVVPARQYPLSGGTPNNADAQHLLESNGSGGRTWDIANPSPQKPIPPDTIAPPSFHAAPPETESDVFIQLNLEPSTCDPNTILKPNTRAGANLENANLRCKDLTHAYLVGANLRNANLRYAQLQAAALERANLDGANLEQAQLQKAGLAGASLQGAFINRTNLSGAILNNADLTRVLGYWSDLSNASLHNATMRNIHLQNANLEGADLRRADLSYANLNGANLAGANLEGAILVGANLDNANLAGANLNDATLNTASLNEANLQGTELNNASLINAGLVQANLRGANLENAHLRGANLKAANLQDTNLRLADMRDANLEKAILIRTSLVGATNVDLTDATVIGDSAVGANLADADLSNANLSDINFSNANLAGANLSHTNLAGANLAGANLSNANLQHTNLSEANLDNSNLAGANLNNANLIDASLIAADLSNASLQYARLESANLTNAILANTDLRSAHMLEVILENADLTNTHIGLSDAYMRGANLNGANLQGKSLLNANLSGAHLNGANLNNTDLRLANLQDAKLNKANLIQANLEGANLENATLIDANPIRANLQDANLKGANLERADFSGANLDRANLNGANLLEANLARTSQVGTNLATATLRNDPQQPSVIEQIITGPVRAERQTPPSLLNSDEVIDFAAPFTFLSPLESRVSNYDDLVDALMQEWSSFGSSVVHLTQILNRDEVQDLLQKYGKDSEYLFVSLLARSKPEVLRSMIDASNIAYLAESKFSDVTSLLLSAIKHNVHAGVNARTDLVQRLQAIDLTVDRGLAAYQATSAILADIEKIPSKEQYGDTYETLMAGVMRNWSGANKNRDQFTHEDIAHLKSMLASDAVRTTLENHNDKKNNESEKKYPKDVLVSVLARSRYLLPYLLSNPSEIDYLVTAGYPNPAEWLSNGIKHNVHAKPNSAERQRLEDGLEEVTTNVIIDNGVDALLDLPNILP